MAKLYPHKQTLFIGTISIAIIAGAIYYANPDFLIKKNAWLNVGAKENNTALVMSNIEYLPDSDWKKSFANAPSVQAYTKSTTNKESETLTDRLGKDFFTRYVELRQNNLSGSEQSVKSAMDQTIDSAVTVAPKPKIFNASEIKVTENSDPASIRSYANNIASAFIKYGPRIDPTTIAVEALEKEDNSMIAKIKPITSSYNNLVKSVQTIFVPRSLSSQHLRLLNALNSMLFVSQGLEKVLEDPMQSMIALGMYNESKESIRSSLYSISNYLNKNTIYFDTNEPGIFFSTIPSSL